MPFRCIERGAGLVAAGPWADVQDKVLLVALPGVAHKQRGCAARRTCRIPQRILLSTATDRSLE